MEPVSYSQYRMGLHACIRFVEQWQVEIKNILWLENSHCQQFLMKFCGHKLSIEWEKWIA